MNNIITNLTNSLCTGFVDSTHPSNSNYQPRILVNDNNRGEKVLTTIQNELLSCNEFFFAVAFVTNSGVATLINTLETLKENRIKGRILVSQKSNFTEPIALKRLLQYKNIELKIQSFF